MDRKSLSACLIWGEWRDWVVYSSSLMLDATARESKRGREGHDV
jgi:hypothetical protein